jgi:ABC-type sugar transport system ATPase subunit
MNLFNARILDADGGNASVTFDGLTGAPLVLPIRPGSNVSTGDAVSLGVRPEHLVVGQDGPHTINAKVEFWEQFGDLSYGYAPDYAAGSVIATRRESHEGELERKFFKMAIHSSKCMLFGADGRSLNS